MPRIGDKTPCFALLMLSLSACSPSSPPNPAPAPAPNIEQKTQAKVESAIDANTKTLDAAIEAQSAGDETPPHQ
jgi:hypothetical protein